jgi:hypothetical protein
MKRLFLIAAISAIFLSGIQSQTVQTPEEFFGYTPGTQFTFHHKAVEYFKYIAEVSPLAEYRQYGTTYEGRTLGVCFVSTTENLSKLEEYRKNNLIKAGLLNGESTGKQIPFVWLAFNVHGNEAVGMEAAIKTLYTLVSGSYKNIQDYLSQCIIVIDPCQNPDGHELYTSRYRSTMSLLNNPDSNSWEHNQGWPGARSNHYMFDLNRDWTWQTQTETQQRLKFYNQYMPQVHADFHEMGPESTYFFAPGANPWHVVFTPWQHEFHTLMGKGNAAIFDEKYKMYFTKENFDLFYPSFGDTWPLLNGAMGFTYEQGGGGVSGIALKLESGDTLTLKDRIDGHFSSAMATIKVACENREKLMTEFYKYFADGKTNPAFQYKSVIVKGSNEKSEVSAMLDLLSRNQINYSQVGNIGKKVKGFDYSSRKESEFTIEKGDILISAYQPQSHMMQVLFEPDSKNTDSISYDITAWALPYVYSLKAYALTERIPADTGSVEIRKVINSAPKEKSYAYIVNFQGFDELKFIAAIYNKEIHLRYSLKNFKINGMNFNRGSIIIARGDNRQFEGDLDKVVEKIADDCQVSLVPVTTGMVDMGRDLGSDYSPLMKKKSVAILCGESTSAGSVGELWYFFERELKYPVTLYNIDGRNIDFKKYDILILTSGNYSKLKDTIVDFVKRGGRVIAMENSISVFAGEKSTALAKAIETRTAEQKLVEKKIKSDDSTLLKKYELAIDSRYTLTERSASSIYKVKLDDTHPYAFGMGKEWFLLKRTAGYPFLATGNNIGYITTKEPLSGFAGFKYKDKIKNTLVIGSENIGSGEVIYITDDPYFRAFWKSGRILLGNTILR